MTSSAAAAEEMAANQTTTRALRMTTAHLPDNSNADQANHSSRHTPCAEFETRGVPERVPSTRNMLRSAHGVCRLLWHRFLTLPKQIVADAEAGREWIVGDVSAQVFELLGAADQMIEALLLPEPTSPSECPIQLDGGVFLPRVTLLFQVRIAQQGDEDVRVVGHHDEVAEPVTLAVEVH